MSSNSNPSDPAAQAAPSAAAAAAAVPTPPSNTVEATQEPPRNVTPTPSASDTSTASTPSTAAAALPLSPARPPQPQGPSVPSSPAPSLPPPSNNANNTNTTITSDRSPAITPQKPPQWQPQQRQQSNSGVVLGLEQLERQQDEAERRRRELLKQQQQQPSTTSTPVRQPIQHAPQQQSPHQHQHQHPPVFHMQRYLEDTDDHTAPSTTQNHSLGTDGSTSLGSGDDHPATSTNTRPSGIAARGRMSSTGSNKSVSVKFEKMIQKTRKRLSSSDFFIKRRNSGDVEDPAEDEEAEAVDALIYGHLQKLGRNGKWQTRWFETDGECLSYYKTSKRTKLLATLDLEKVGSIVVNEDDPKGCTLTIQVLGRPYYLRAESRAACKDWVITLNRVKEARLQQGNVKLATPHSSFRPPDLLNRNLSTYTPGVVAVANRQRTRAMDEATIENMEELHKADPNHAQYNPAYGVPYGGSGGGGSDGGGQGDDDLGGSLSDIVLARWQKRKSSMSRLASKLARWARSLNKYKCNDMGGNQHDDDVRLDQHVHPPGHDDARKRSAKKRQQQGRNPHVPSPTGWIGQETSYAVKSGPVVPAEPDHHHHHPGMDLPTGSEAMPMAQHHVTAATPAPNDDDDEEETRELS